MEKPNESGKRKLRILLVCALLLLVPLFFLLRGIILSGSVLSVADVRAKGIDSEALVDVNIDRLGSTLYPAASFIIDFDKARLELLDVREGNVFVSSETGEILPNWSVNIGKSNESGQIKIMYVDVTGGTQAFSQALIPEEGGVLFRLCFRVRGSAREGEAYSLNVEDAVFAANKEKDSLSSLRGTLRVKNGSIFIEVE